jgi:hypothetical protein
LREAFFFVSSRNEEEKTKKNMKVGCEHLRLISSISTRSLHKFADFVVNSVMQILLHEESLFHSVAAYYAFRQIINAVQQVHLFGGLFDNDGNP